MERCRLEQNKGMKRNGNAPMGQKGRRKPAAPGELKKPLREGEPRIVSDALGSYTGIDEDGEAPVQDADDL